MRAEANNLVAYLFLKTDTIDNAKIIAANPIATPAIAILIAGEDAFFSPSPLLKWIRLAINNSKFNVLFF